MDHRIAALILAGGASRRMGQDKALLSVPSSAGNRTIPLLAHVSHMASACAERVHVLTPWPERYADFLSPSVVLLPEVKQHSGPLVALLQGWSLIVAHGQKRGETAPDWLLVLACDMPALDAAILQTWCHSLQSVRPDAIAALPQHQGRWEPLCGFYRQSSFRHLSLAIQQDVRSFQRWLANESVASLSVNDSNVLQNCNNPAQWQNFLAQQDARNP
ncbi:molybdenum cofactor guanylyltransferase [Leptothoe kymatousa]|uniref:Probable molybdenum cofactor guanylyltransferase n=1 Tax=Leptothoe kymatousa TAU-MAC 1615 TaxID=2364775 RepID=A0ABS5Y2Q1_9CYAN|nr:molybdenum cofactor guanylyltransferase [Leptothoe kymatousa]MBT9312087.1 molybdenum cofactor guanylyltransferase [Leptothoe kymatousa TAU-MAC 1615]